VAFRDQVFGISDQAEIDLDISLLGEKISSLHSISCLCEQLNSLLVRSVISS
jgi:hypothetical protein